MMNGILASSAGNCSSKLGPWVTTQSKLRYQNSLNNFGIKKKKIKNWAVFRQLNRFKTKQYYHCHEIPMNGDLCIISTFIYYGDTSGYPGTQNKIYQKVQTHKWPLTGGQEQKTTHYSRTNILLRDILGEDPLSYKNTQEWCLSAY